jgi:hypothetical protein
MLTTPSGPLTGIARCSGLVVDDPEPARFEFVCASDLATPSTSTPEDLLFWRLESRRVRRECGLFRCGEELLSEDPLLAVTSIVSSPGGAISSKL